MLLWIILAVLTAAVAALLLAPFGRVPAAAQQAGGSASRSGEVAVYRDQLKELDRDLAAGLITGSEAENARAEIGRRLIAAAAGTGNAAAPDPQRRHRLAAAVVTLAPPAIGLCLYLTLGSPGLPDQPLEARLADPGNNVALLVAKVERHLATSPDDGAGWDLLAPIYFRSQRLGDAELAYRHAIRLLGPTSERLAGLGEVLVAGNGGIVVEDARFAFEEAVRRDPKNFRARFYVALAQQQAGRRAEAKAGFEAIAAESPPGAPWLDMVRQHIAENDGTPDAPSGPDAAAIEAAASLSADDRRDMIRGMVEGLAARLEDRPDDLAGWLRLVRSYRVLGDDAAASDAVRKALARFPGAPELLALAGEIGMAAPAGQEGATQ